MYDKRGIKYTTKELYQRVGLVDLYLAAYSKGFEFFGNVD
ncbi:hypothetical protein LCGC14_1849210 [marine sediment metagenome]|uniref:Uncharacterized protein n=1 Tax=marine sediment metagenome TaxID=412755 RepID=A0A0F8Y269_9ZZZZ